MSDIRRVPGVRASNAARASIVNVPVAAPQYGRRDAIASGAAVPSASGFYARRGKRIIDMALATALLIVFAPLFAAVGLVVLAVSGWPVFYGSRRIGRGGIAFPMWKFRTMARDADAVFEHWKVTHPERAERLLTDWSLDDDPRVTALGRFLRKSSLDELPQFWNVLRGEMSIVGPRPYLVRESLDPALAPAITAVRPGITGPFQVLGRKTLLPQSRMAIEAGYATRMSFLRDVRYVVSTAIPLLTLDGH